MGCSAHVIPTQRQTSVAPDPADGPLTTLPEESVAMALADGPPPARLPKSVAISIRTAIRLALQLGLSRSPQVWKREAPGIEPGASVFLD